MFGLQGPLTDLDQNNCVEHDVHFDKASSVVVFSIIHELYGSGVQHYTRASGHARLEGLQVPSDEVE